MQRRQPKKFVSIVWRKTPIGTSSMGPPAPTPALFTRTSIRPWSAITLPIAASTEPVVIDVELHDRDRQLLLGDGLAQLRAALKVSHPSEHGVAGPRKRDGGRQTDAGAGARDQWQLPWCFSSLASKSRM